MAGFTAASDVGTKNTQKQQGVRAGDAAMRKELYQDAEEAYESALAAYPDDNDEYAGMTTLRKKLDKCKEEAEIHGASIRIQAVFRKKKAIAFVSEKKKAAAIEQTRFDALTPEQQEDEKEQKRLSKLSQRERLEQAAKEDALNARPEGAMDGIGNEEIEKAPYQITIVKILDSSLWMYFTIFNTTYALFAQDIALWSLPKSADYTIAVMTFIVFLCFLFEWVGNMVGGREYGAATHSHEKMDMFFWLDCIGTFSLIPDFLIVFTGEEMEVPDYVILARVARAARIGARLSRLTKLFRIAGKHEKKDPYEALRIEHEAAEAALNDGDASTDPDAEEQAAKEEELEEAAVEESMSSEIGDKVTEGISKRVIGLVITLLVFVPIFTYQEPRGGVRKTKSDMIYMAHSMKRMDQDLHLYDAVADGSRTTSRRDTCTQEIVQVDGSDTYGPWKCECKLANGDVDPVQDCKLVTSYKDSMDRLLSYQNDHVIYMTWDRDVPGLKPRDCKSDDGYSQWSCQDAIRKPGMGLDDLSPALVYNQKVFGELRKAEIRKYGDEDLDPHQEPIPDSYDFYRIEMWVDYRDKTQSEAATNIVYMLVVSFIFALASLVFMMDLNELVIEPTENMSGAMRMVSAKLMDLGGEVGPDGEAAYIESSIIKIVALLNVSFGEAGTRIISANMSGGSSEIQPMIPGAKVAGVYGFCDIREFTATTEALRERIVVFVNEFGTITHERCIESGGAPNKNVGDAFLCCWLDKDDEPPSADDALVCYRRTINDIRVSEQLTALCDDRAIMERFPPNQQEFGKYYARMGIGLHYGDSIEGAIGTSKKIDASYLGPDVDLADVLEATTKIYKTPILMSEIFWMLLSPEQQQTCRKVDKVQYEDGEPFWLYAANVACDRAGNYFEENTFDDVMPIEIDAALQQKLTFGKIDGSEDPRANDERWRTLIHDWNQTFEQGVDAYVAGDWSKAKDLLVRLFATHIVPQIGSCRR